jgi:hypothetical protein
MSFIMMVFVLRLKYLPAAIERRAEGSKNIYSSACIMALYHHAVNVPLEIPTTFYARDPTHIEDLVLYYQFEAIKHFSTYDHPKAATWVKAVPDPRIIPTIPRGLLMYLSKDCLKKGEPFETLRVADDFTIYLSKDLATQFTTLAKNMRRFRRGSLYKILVPGLLPSLTFIPEDIAERIREYDLSDLRSKENTTSS